MKYLISLCATMVCALSLTAQINFVHEEWGKAKAQAKAENKILFVDAYTTWCGPCKWMAKNVFTDSEVGTFYNTNFVNLKLDMEKGEGLEFAEAYEVNAYPTLLYLDGDGKLLHKQLGAVPADQFLTVGQDAMSPDRRISAFTDKYKAKKHDKAFVQEYLMKTLGAGLNVKSEADAYFSMLADDEVVTEENLLILRMLYPSMDSEAFNVLLKHRSDFERLEGNDVVDDIIETTMNTAVYRAVLSEDPEAYTAVRAQVLKMDLREKDKLVALGDMEYSDAQGDMEGYLAHAESYGKTHVWNDWNELNNLAWDMYLNSSLSGSQMKLANKFAKRAVKLESNHYTTDTYASVFYKEGKYKCALKWAQIAVDQAKASESDYSGTSELIEKIKAEMD